MGEYADMALDAGFSDWGEDDYYISRRRSSTTFKECRRCGGQKLYWKQVDSKWRLFEVSGYEHECR